jgi:hypothetical protein
MYRAYPNSRRLLYSFESLHQCILLHHSRVQYLTENQQYGSDCDKALTASKNGYLNDMAMRTSPGMHIQDFHDKINQLMIRTYSFGPLKVSLNGFDALK